MSRKAKYNLEELKDAIKTSVSMADVCRKLNLKLAGGTLSHLKFKCLRENIDISHFLGKSYNKGKLATNRKTHTEILVEISTKDYRVKSYLLRRALLESGFEYKCNTCGINKWNNEKIVLEIDHINGKYWDNKKENLQFMCPNCHSIKTKKGRSTISKRL